MVVRKSLRISRALFAAYLRTNVRTLENWEQRPRQAERASRPTNQPVIFGLRDERIQL